MRKDIVDAEECDGDYMTVLEKAAVMLTPGASLDTTKTSIHGELQDYCQVSA